MRGPRHTATLLTGPASEPVTADELVTFARIDSDIAEAESGLLAAFIAAARQAAEQFTRRSFLTQSWRLSLDLACRAWADGLPEGTYDLPVTALYGALPAMLRLPHGPVRSVASVTTYGLDNTATAFDSANYTLDAAGARLSLNPGCLWPSGLRPLDAVHIDYAAGYGDAASSVPQAIRTAITMHAADLYESRGMCGDDVPGRAQQLLRPYRVLAL